MDFNALLAEARRDPNSRGASAGPSGGQDKEHFRKFWGVGHSPKKQKLTAGKNIKVIGSDEEADEARVAPMRMVVPGVWVGAEEAAEAVETLKENLVTHIVALTGRKPSHESKDFDYLLLDTIDDPKYPLNNHFEEAIRFMKEALDNDTAVLVHCAAGMSRGPSIVIAYLIAVQGMTYQDAFALVREKRPITCPNEGFRAQLRTFEETMRQKKEASSADSDALQKEVWDLKDRITQLEKQLTQTNKRHEEFVLELMEDYSVEKKMRMIREEHKRVEAEKEREKIKREQKEKEEKEKKARTDRLREERAALLARKQVRAENVNTGKGKEKVKEEEKKDEGDSEESHTLTTPKAFVAFSGQEEGESTPKQLEEVENVYARVARLEGENKKKEEKIQKLLENRKKMRDANSQLKGYQKSYQRQLDESHEEAIFNIKMLQEHFHKENKKMEDGKLKEIENIEQTLKRKENEAEIWKAQAIKMEKQFDDLMARVKIVAGFIAVVFIAWMCYIFLVAPALGAPNPSASAHSSFVISTKLTALMSIHWPENLKAAENLSLAFSSGNVDRFTMVLLSAPPAQHPLLLSLLSGALTDEFLYPLPEISSLKKTQLLGNHTLFLSPLTTEELIDDIYTHLTTTTLTTIPPTGERASAVFFIYAKDVVNHLTAFSRWADHPFYLEDFEADGTKRGVTLKNTCFFVIADDSATKLVTSFTSSRKGKVPVTLHRVTFAKA